MKKYVLLLLLTVTGCMKIGPSNLKDDSMQYNHAVHSSVDKQLLLNMVRLRYRDNPTFLQVGIITSAYEFKRVVGMDGKFDFKGSVDEMNMSAWSLSPKAAAEYNEKPTITYSPVRGESFSKEMLSPVSMGHIMLLHTSGWKIDRILRTLVQRMNDLPNAPTASGPTPSVAPEYDEFAELSKNLRSLELKDKMRIVTQKHPESGHIGFFIIFEKSENTQAELSRIWDLLDLEPGTTKVQLIPYHGKEHGPNEVMVDTRSPLSILYFLSQSVEAPYWDETSGRVTVTQDEQGNTFEWERVLDGIMSIKSTQDARCVCPAVATCYRGTYFYIDDTDLNSKSTFQMLTQLLALQTSCPQLPVLTLPLTN
jgi:hypothetical protein